MTGFDCELFFYKYHAFILSKLTNITSNLSVQIKSHDQSIS